LLHALLDRFEAPKERVRDITHPIDYRTVGGPAAQDEFHRVLRDAERAEGIILEKEKLGRFTGEYARVRLADPNKLYTFLVRSPAGSLARAARTEIHKIIPEILHDPFFLQIEGEAFDAWRSNKSFLGYTVDQAASFVTLLQLTHGIVNLAGRDVDHRTFSRRIVKNSKALERCEARVAQLLRRRFPHFAYDDPREVLKANGIVRRAHLLQVKGPLQLSANGLKVDGTGQAFIGLPWQAVQKATLNHPVDYVLTIENPTSFWRFCTEIGGNYLALLTDGFPARDVLSGIVHLVKSARAVSDAPIYHWGDIDAGGLRIAAHLEDAIGQSVTLHEMTPALAMEFGTPLQSRVGLNKLKLRDGDVGSLATWLSSDEGRSLEQEELDPISPMSGIVS